MRITALFIILIFLVGACSCASPDNMEIPGIVEEVETENTEICMINGSVNSTKLYGSILYRQRNAYYLWGFFPL